MFNRNMNARNFGLGSRDINKAAKNALREREMSFSSIATMTDRFRRFSEWLREHEGIKDLRWVTKDVLHRYAEHVKQQGLATSTAHNYISAVNIVMQQARQDKEVKVSPVAYVGRRSAICIQSKAISLEKFQHVKSSLDGSNIGERQAMVIELGMELGLRPKEASLLDSKRALKQAFAMGKIKVDRGTKGGRPRMVPISQNSQLEALLSASKLQGDGRSIMPLSMNWKSWRERLYPDLRRMGLNGARGGRHLYAQQLYYQKTGVHPPVVAGVRHGAAHHHYISKTLNIRVSEARSIDFQARIEVAEALGHGRIGITNNYLG